MYLTALQLFSDMGNYPLNVVLPTPGGSVKTSSLFNYDLLSKKRKKKKEK